MRDLGWQQEQTAVCVTMANAKPTLWVCVGAHNSEQMDYAM